LTRLAYIDAIGGLAGDMLVGALLHAGADLGRVRDGLAGLGVPGIELDEEKVQRHGILASRVTMLGRSAGGAGAADDEPSHRSWAEIRVLLDGGGMPERALSRAHAVFRALAEAEGRVHGVPAEDVRFHEVGAVDSIGDISAIALALEDLGIDELVCSALPMPRGFVDAAHGRLPLPAPATLELLRGAPVYGVDLDVELVTPTGAAVVAALASGFGRLPAIELEAVGYGAGTRDLDACPNLTRVLVGQRPPTGGAGHSQDQFDREEAAVLIETNLDDLSPELVPDAAERCFAAGALDVWVVPVQMKKSRPGVVFSALARPADEQAVARAILRETTALGLRVSAVRRWELERSWVTVELPGGPVRVKLGMLDGVTVNAAPEHDDCAELAGRTGRPVKAVWAAALAAAQGAYDR
jgi:uncharacterized protein (TIGR00299 family) protein